MNEAIINAYEHLIREGRIKRQQDIVEKTGFHKSTISEILSGKKLASESFIKKFEEVFKIKSTDDMIVDIPNGNGGSKDSHHEHYNVRLEK